VRHSLLGLSVIGVVVSGVNFKRCVKGKKVA
jgi:hypothetical protein